MEKAIKHSLIASAIITGICFIILTVMSNVNIDLPEEYESITRNDTLKGYYEDGVLHIEFNNKRNH